MILDVFLKHHENTVYRFVAVYNHIGRIKSNFAFSSKLITYDSKMYVILKKRPLH